MCSLIFFLAWARAPPYYLGVVASLVQASWLSRRLRSIFSQPCARKYSTDEFVRKCDAPSVNATYLPYLGNKVNCRIERESRDI
jgi:hypothetical protein